MEQPPDNITSKDAKKWYRKKINDAEAKIDKLENKAKELGPDAITKEEEMQFMEAHAELDAIKQAYKTVLTFNKYYDKHPEMKGKQISPLDILNK